MADRSQSDVIGVVLLTLVISLTVTATGAVTLTEWQSDLGGDPVADIESELDVDRVALEHFGGDRLNASETVVLVDNEVAIPLGEFEGVDDQFIGGMRISSEDFEPVAGEVSLRVVHEPSQTVVHSDSYGLQFLFLVEGETGPVYMFEEPPVNFTAEEDAELTLSDPAVIDFDRDSSTISSQRIGSTTITAIDGDKEQTTNLSVIEPGQLGIETVDVNSTGADSIVLTSELTELGKLDETDLYVRYRKQQPVTFTGNPDNDEIIADGGFYEDPDGYAHDGRWVHDNTPLVPGTNRTYEYFSESQLFAVVGTLRAEPETEETVYADEFAIEGIEGRVGDFNYLIDDNNVPVNERFEMTVEYSDDGETVNVYVDGTLNWTWTDAAHDIGDYDELYFSTREGGGPPDEADGLRLVSSPTLSEPQYERVDTGVESSTVDTSILRGLQSGTTYFVEAYTERQITNGVVNATGRTLAVRTRNLVETHEPTAVSAESVRLEGELLDSFGGTDLSFVVETTNGTVVANRTVATGVDSPRRFSTTVSGLEPNRSYVYRARAEDVTSDGTPITDTGAERRVTTDEPAIETVDVETTGVNSISVDGNLTDIAGLDRMNLFVRYRQQQPVTFTGPSDDNSDEVIAYGEFYEDSDSYAHDGGWIHDNTPLVPGTNRTYEYIDDSDSASIVGTLRADPETETTAPLTADQFAIQELVDNGRSQAWNFLTTDVPQDERFEITVEYSANGDTISVYVKGEHGQTWDSGTYGVDEYHELYFSTREGGDPAGDQRGLELLSSPTVGEWQSEFVATTDTSTPFARDLSGLQPETVYVFETYAEQTVGGSINATGKRLAARTEKLVETRAPTAVTAESVQLEAELLDSLGNTTLSFVVETADGTEVRNTTVATGVGGPRPFNTTIEKLEPDRSYVYYARAEESDGTTVRITDTGAERRFTTDEPAIETVDVTAAGPDGLTVDGNLTDIAGLDRMNLSVSYRQQQSVTFTGPSDDNSDEVIAYGEFYDDSDSYAHDGGWIHDNTPLVPGTNRTYEYIDDSDSASIVGTLRADPETETTAPLTADQFAIQELVDNGRSQAWNFLTTDVPQDGRFEITVEYTADGDTISVYVEGERGQTWDSGTYDVDEYHELYFSTREGGDPAGDQRGLEMLSSPTVGEWQSEFVATTTTSTTFTGTLSGLEPDTVYFVAATANRTVNGQPINATGRTLAARTDDS